MSAPALATSVIDSAMPPALAKYIATRDRRIEKTRSWDRRAMSGIWLDLMRNKSVKVGGRATCGTSADPSWAQFVAWGEIVKKAKSLGYVIRVAPIKQKNRWATNSGGFWDENEYVLESTP